MCKLQSSVELEEGNWRKKVDTAQSQASNAKTETQNLQIAIQVIRNFVLANDQNPVFLLAYEPDFLKSIVMCLRACAFPFIPLCQCATNSSAFLRSVISLCERIGFKFVI